MRKEVGEGVIVGVGVGDGVGSAVGTLVGVSVVGFGDTLGGGVIVGAGEVGAELGASVSRHICHPG